MSEFSIIITAGGIGKRMGGTLPKQFILIGGKPILLHTLEKIYSFNAEAQIIITLPEDWQSYWEKLCVDHDCQIQHTLVNGGEERFHSIKNALSYCSGKYVAVHDGVRPFVSVETLTRCFDAVKIFGQVIPVVSLKESIRKVEKGSSHAVIRSEYCTVQTPQVFLREVLVKAYEKTYSSTMTDDASLVEAAGYVIHLTGGNEENIKITSQIDILLAEAFLAQNK